MSLKNEISAYVEKLTLDQQLKLLDFLATIVKLKPEAGDIVITSLADGAVDSISDAPSSNPNMISQ